MLKHIYRLMRWIFFMMIIRFLVLIVLGLNIRNRDRLPKRGPAVIVANHNSHLDTAVLISLFPGHLLPMAHPVAAADYFLSNRFMKWFSKNIVGIIPISRDGNTKTDPLSPCYSALERGDILILFPEGTRGEPEHITTFKKGISFIAKKFPEVPIIPVFMHGLGKALPKGELLLVPFFCDVFVGEPLYWQGDQDQFMDNLHQSFESLTHTVEYAAFD